MAPNPTGLVLMSDVAHRVSKDGPARRLVCTPGSILRGPLPQDEAGGRLGSFDFS
jgi:hypothetical protein